MKKTTMKRIAAAIAAMTLCSMAVAPMAAEAATIKITDSATNTVSMKDKTFAAYKIFNVTKIGTGEDASYVYTVADGWDSFIADYLNLNSASTTFDVDAAAKMAATGDKAIDVEDFAKKAYAHAKANDIKATYTSVAGDYSTNASEGVAATTETVTLTGITANGYYMIADTSTGSGAISAVMLDQIDSTEDVTISLKADQPTITKKIVEGDNRVDANTATIDDTVTYELKTFVPDNTEYYNEYEFVISDTIDPGLDFDTDSVAIKVGTNKTLVSPTDYVVYFADTDGDANGHLDKMTIRFYTIDYLGRGTDLQGLGLAGQDIIVTVDATVNERANIGTIGNENDVWLTYSNNPNVSGDGKLYNDSDQDTDGDGTPDSTDDDDDNDGKNDDEDTDDDNDGTLDTDEPTKDSPDNTSEENTPEDTVVTYLAKFQIKKVNDAGAVLSGAKFTVKNTASDYSEEFTSDANGMILISGIEAGTYTVTETEAPSGYNKLDAPFEVVVGCKVDGIALPDANEDVVYADTTGDTCEWTVTSATGTVDSGSGVDTIFKVVNNAGAIFPTTGGMGTTIFTVLGVSLMAGAAGAFAIKRKTMDK